MDFNADEAGYSIRALQCGKRWFIFAGEIYRKWTCFCFYLLGGMYITTGPEYWEDEDRYRGILYRGHIISPISCPLFPPFSMVSLLMCRGRRGPISFCPIRLVHHVLLPFQFQIKLGSNHCYGQKEKKKEKKRPSEILWIYGFWCTHWSVVLEYDQHLSLPLALVQSNELLL